MGPMRSNLSIKSPEWSRRLRSLLHCHSFIGKSVDLVKIESLAVERSASGWSSRWGPRDRRWVPATLLFEVLLVTCSFFCEFMTHLSQHLRGVRLRSAQQTNFYNIIFSPLSAILFVNLRRTIASVKFILIRPDVNVATWATIWMSQYRGEV